MLRNHPRGRKYDDETIEMCFRKGVFPYEFIRDGNRLITIEMCFRKGVFLYEFISDKNRLMGKNVPQIYTRTVTITHVHIPFKKGIFTHAINISIYS